MVGPDSGLRRAIAADRVPSMIFFGRPGAGKTPWRGSSPTAPGWTSWKLSAVQDGRRRCAAGTWPRRTSGWARRDNARSCSWTNPSLQQGQQDALVPARRVAGRSRLIGATTENPYFEVNSALLSRCQLYQLDAIDRDALGRIVERGAAELGVSLADGVRETIVSAAGGDGRNALNIIEAAAAVATEGACVGRTRWMRPASSRCCTTRAATVTTTRSRRSSRACAAPMPTRRCTTWRS